MHENVTPANPDACWSDLTSMIVYSMTNYVFVGDLNCPTCALIRGALVGVVSGGIYPILLALPVNAGLAAR